MDQPAPAADLKRTIELNPREASAYMSLASLRFDEKNWPEAITNYGQVVALERGHD